MPEDRTAVTRLLTGATRLVLPTRCAGCNRAEEVVCRACRDAVTGSTPLRRALRDGTEVTVSCRWRGPARGLVLAAKERGRRDVVPVLAAALARCVARAGWSQPRAGPTLLLVAPPPALGSTIRRAGDPTWLLADRAAAQLRAAGADVRAVRALRRRRRVADQAGLDPEQRAANLQGAFGVVARVRPRAWEVVVVDDVVTTGSTVVESVRALREGGFDVVGAAAVATA